MLTAEVLKESVDTIRDCLPSTIYHMGAAGKLALAYLAEHPADDAAPVTAEWLRTLGMSPGGFRDLVTYKWVSETESMYVEIQQYKANGWEMNGGGLMGSITRGKVPTRGHVRRLCAALGITLHGEQAREGGG